MPPGFGATRDSLVSESCKLLRIVRTGQEELVYGCDFVEDVAYACWPGLPSPGTVTDYQLVTSKRARCSMNNTCWVSPYGNCGPYEVHERDINTDFLLIILREVGLITALQGTQGVRGPAIDESCEAAYVIQHYFGVGCH
eukprot:3952301-Amphidinium_carterae.1